MKQISLKNAITRAQTNFLFFLCSIFIFISCANIKPVNLEEHIGLYEVVNRSCNISTGSFNPCTNTYFIEIVKGKFSGVNDSELSYVFWSGYPNIDHELQYSSHLINEPVLSIDEGNKFWLNKDDDSQEYFEFTNGVITGYYVKHMVNKSDKDRVIKYSLKPVTRKNLKPILLNYPINN